jgi:hypothetical protein
VVDSLRDPAYVPNWWTPLLLILATFPLIFFCQPPAGYYQSIIVQDPYPIPHCPCTLRIPSSQMHMLPLPLIDYIAHTPPKAKPRVIPRKVRKEKGYIPSSADHARKNVTSHPENFSPQHSSSSPSISFSLSLSCAPSYKPPRGFAGFAAACRLPRQPIHLLPKTPPTLGFLASLLPSKVV